jgi:hypothetical protein
MDCATRLQNTFLRSHFSFIKLKVSNMAIALHGYETRSSDILVVFHNREGETCGLGDTLTEVIFSASRLSLLPETEHLGQALIFSETLWGLRSYTNFMA